MKTFGKAMIILIAIPVTIFVIRQIIMSIENSRAITALSEIESYSQDYYSTNKSYESLCSDEKISSLLQPFISKPRMKTGNEALDIEYQRIDAQNKKIWCFGDKERYNVQIRFKLNNILDRYCEISNTKKPLCSHDTP